MIGLKGGTCWNVFWLLVPSESQSANISDYISYNAALDNIIQLFTQTSPSSSRAPEKKNFTDDKLTTVSDRVHVYNLKNK